MLTPVQLETLAHFYYSSTLLPDTPAFKEAKSYLLCMGLLEDSKEGLRTTRIGSAYVKSLCALPFPQEKLVYVDQMGNVIPE